MKILFVKPYSLSDHIQPPLGLGFLANTVRNKNEVRIVDCLKDGIRTPLELMEIIKKFNPEIVGLQCYTVHLRFIKELCTQIKKFNNYISCIIGGPHPSTLPKDSLKWFGSVVDYAFCGEAEIGFPMLVERLNKDTLILSDIPGLIWRENAEINVNPVSLPENLDNLGFPSWELLRPDKYPESQHGAFFKKFPIAPIILTRGCPYLCTFCAGNKISGKKIRRHSIDYGIKQIEMLYKDFGIREFHIVDDNFTFDINYAKSFLKSLIGLNLDISWATPNGVRLDRLDIELLNLMKKSGLYLISLGIESGSDRVLKLMQKGITVDLIKEKVKMIRSVGIDIAGFFIIGYPGETREDIEKTISLACSLDLIRSNFFIYLPFPGTQSYLDLVNNGELENVNWDNFYFTSAAYVPNGFSKLEIKNYQRKAFFKFYLRPNIFLKNLMQIKSRRHFMFLFKRFYNWIISW